MKNWESLNEFFDVLNENTNYLVLRNYEEFSEGDIVSDHPDIDILCADRDEFLEHVCSESRSSKEDKIHRRIIINSKRVDLDVRHVGDGYYDTRWEQNMLETKRSFNGLCYIMNNENYYYSLLYHALIQKYEISPDYNERLSRMACDFEVADPLSINTLESYMLIQGYKYTYPIFPGGIVNFAHVNKKMIEHNMAREAKRFYYLWKKKIINLITK